MNKSLPMYVLCKSSPSAKKTPHIYEMNSCSICPVCGEYVKTSFNPPELGAASRGHIASDNLDVLMKYKKRKLEYRRKWLRKEA